MPVAGVMVAASTVNGSNVLFAAPSAWRGACRPLTKTLIEGRAPDGVNIARFRCGLREAVLPSPDAIAYWTLWATVAGSGAAVVAALSALWIAHQSNARDDRRRQQDKQDQIAAFKTAVRISIRKVGSMTRTIEEAGDGVLTKTLFVGGVDSAKVAIDYALRLGVADDALLQLALDAKGAFDLLSLSLEAYDKSEYVGDRLSEICGLIDVVIKSLKQKHPDVDLGGDDNNPEEVRALARGERT